MPGGVGGDRPVMVGPYPDRCSGFWPAHNSLRSLRSLRSGSVRESVDEAREYARRPQPCAAQRRKCAPPGSRPRPCRHHGWFSNDVEHKRWFRKGLCGFGAARICGGEPGHKQSSGLLVPGERPGPWPRCGLQGEQRRASGRARTRAHPRLTREHCLSATSAASEASCERDPNPSSGRESAP